MRYRSALDAVETFIRLTNAREVKGIDYESRTGADGDCSEEPTWLLNERADLSSAFEEARDDVSDAEWEAWLQARAGSDEFDDVGESTRQGRRMVYAVDSAIEEALDRRGKLKRRSVRPEADDVQRHAA